jgi:[protein-PII] uridylyltransferase
LDTSETLKAARARLIAEGPRGLAFGHAYADAVDEACREAAKGVELDGRWALVALGSHARRELCPGSDVDLMLLHDGGARGDVGRDAAQALWYPLWDAGLVLGHAVRTPKEALSLAGAEVDALTGMLDLRFVVGDTALADELLVDTRQLATRRRAGLVSALSSRAAAREERPGPIAEMLEPNLKEGAGGLRDLHSLDWAGWVLGEPGGLDALVEAGHLQPADPALLVDARARLLDARVALHRVTGTNTDVLTLQEQDAVADLLGADDADALVRDLAEAGRAVAWLARDAWRRMDGGSRLPRVRLFGRRRRVLAPGVTTRDGAVALTEDAPIDTETVLRAAEAASRLDLPLERASLERMRALEVPEWTTAARDAFVALLRAGKEAVPVWEGLDQVGILVALIPEWAHVRARPQRNAYHRFTVDRHLLEAVAECATLLDAPGFDGDVARRTRDDLLLLGALLHDIGKGMPGDHSEVGAETARRVVTRLGFDRHGVETVVWLVQQHLLLADTATRRDLSDETTIMRVGRAVHDTERLDLLYALTVGDSRATGPAAWSSPKAALVRQLFAETDALLERGVIGETQDRERQLVLERHAELLARGELAVVWVDRDDGLVECTVAAPDRTGLLATVTGVLAIHGFDIRSASAYGDDAGMALEVYRGVDSFGRLDDDERDRVAADLASALAGTLPVRERLDARFRRYRRRRRVGGDGVRILFDPDASSAATVVEVHAPDEVGLLARITAVFADLGLDVSAAIVQTLGDRVVDVFYLRDPQGAKLTRPLDLARLRATLVARLTADTLAS